MSNIFTLKDYKILNSFDIKLSGQKMKYYKFILIHLFFFIFVTARFCTK